MDKSSLTAEESQVVEVLLEDWKDLLRCTAIHQVFSQKSCISISTSTRAGRSGTATLPLPGPATHETAPGFYRLARFLRGARGKFRNAQPVCSKGGETPV